MALDPVTAIAAGASALTLLGKVETLFRKVRDKLTDDDRGLMQCSIDLLRDRISDEQDKRVTAREEAIAQREEVERLKAETALLRGDLRKGFEEDSTGQALWRLNSTGGFERTPYCPACVNSDGNPQPFVYAAGWWICDTHKSKVDSSDVACPSRPRKTS